ncbi:hypothetical protein KQI84_08190 [bacterium]|nr:hypothetical protein [bacterium]
MTPNAYNSEIHRWTAISRTFLLATILLVASPQWAEAAALGVDHNATGTGDCASWTNAFVSVSDAVSSATAGDEIWIADGTDTEAIDSASTVTLSVEPNTARFGCGIAIVDPGGPGPGQSDPLFVDLLSFTASTTGAGSTVLVEWVTAAEVNIVGFEIYRATPDGSGGYSLGEKLTTTLIPGKGDPTSGATYEFTDTETTVAGEERWYMLEEIDIVGSSLFHGPAHVAVPADEMEFWTVH